jgi:glucose-6-phosphate isomerase, archaeal
LTTRKVQGAESLWHRSGLDIGLKADTIELAFGPTTVHPDGERRTIDQVLPMMSDPKAKGPAHLYTIYMDICNEDDLPALQRQGLLYGAVVYNYGSIGAERLRSQGHIHSEKAGTGLRYSEVYEFWTGHGFVYLQKECSPQVSRALLVPVGPGDKVIVPLGWAHLTVAAADEVLSFGAWCARANKLEYHQLRAMGGPAHFLLSDGNIVANPRYDSVPEVETVSPRDLPLLGIPYDQPIYTAWQAEPARFDFLPRPELVGDALDGL